MMIGHSMLAFALAAGGARLLGWSDERALRFGVVAAAFALVPDADMVYAIFGVARADLTGVFVVTNAFWGASTEVHRSATHSLVLAVPAAAGFALWMHDDRRARVASLAVLSGIAVVAYLATGPLDAFAVVAFGVAGLAVATVVARREVVGPAAALAAALVGLASHPFGDVFTGTVPVFLYPLDVPVLDGIVVLSADPTLHLLGAFGLELATVWFAGLVYLHLTGTGVAATVDRRAALGVLYAPVAFLLPPPTLSVSYHFVFTILGVGFVLAVPARRMGLLLIPFGGRPLGADTDGGVSDLELPDTLDPTGDLAGLDPTGDPDDGSPVPHGGLRRSLPRVVLTGTAAVTAAWVASVAVYALA